MQKAIEFVPVLKEKSCKQHLKSAHVSVGRGESLFISSCLPLVEGEPQRALTLPRFQLALVCGHQAGLMEASAGMPCVGR